MPKRYTVDINPIPNVPFQQLLIQDVFRLKSPDAAAPYRPTFFWCDGKVYRAGFPIVGSPNHIPTQSPPSLYPPNAPIVVRTILEPKPGFFANDVEVTLTDIPRVHVYTVSATFGDLEAQSGARLLIDTGSSATWILGEHFLEAKVEDNGQLIPKRHGERARIGRRLYRPGSEASLKGTGSFHAAYRDGAKTVGDVYKDDLYLLSRGNQRVTPATTVTFGVAALANDKALNLEADGILGLGYASPTNFGSPEPPSFLQELNRQYKLDGPFYSLKLRDRAGTLTFGRPPSTAKFVWEKVNTSREQWDVSHGALDMRMQGDAVWKRHVFGNDNIAMIDSGCNLCYVDPETVENMYKSLGGEIIRGTWFIPKSAPDFHIKINLGASWLRMPRRFLHFSSFNERLDYGTLQMRTGWVDTYGAAFLRHVDAYFDAYPAEPRIGFVGTC